MANPFLMTDDDVVRTPMPDISSNPFLMDDVPDEADHYANDNPFFSDATNPFAAYTTEEHDTHELEQQQQQHEEEEAPPETISDVAADEDHGAVQHTMSFFDTTIVEDDDIFPTKPNELNIMSHPYGDDASSDDEMAKIKVRPAPPPRPTPPSKATQDLISSVSDQLDMASTDLLDRIPVTRTPSPVSVRDLHSPSPTPDGVFGDFLDVSEPQQTAMGNILDTDIEPMQSMGNGGGVAADNPFLEMETETVKQVSAPRNVPARPPPPPRPGPPPRPAAPTSAAPSPTPVQQPPQPVDDFLDMFGSTTPTIVKPSAPPTVKTKEDILSLFTAAAPARPPPRPSSVQQQPDLLSGDFSMDELNDTTPLNITGGIIRPIMEAVVSPPQPEVMAVRAVTPDIIPDVIPVALPDVTPEIVHENSIPNIVYDPPAPDELDLIDEIAECTPQPPSLDQSPISSAVNPFATPPDDMPDELANSDYHQSPSIALPPALEMDISDAELSDSQFDTDRALVADEFDAFTAKFDSARKDDRSITPIDGFTSGAPSPFPGATPFGGPGNGTGDAWGDSSSAFGDSEIGAPAGDGFGGDEGFDSFLAMRAPVPEISRTDSRDSDDDKEFNVVIRPKEADLTINTGTVILAPPPPARTSQNSSMYSGDSSPRLNPFDKSFGEEVASTDGVPELGEIPPLQRTDSQETPPTPLFDDDVSQPLEDFPRIIYSGDGWEMQLRQPNKKKITGQRFWKKIFMRLVVQGENPVLQLYNLPKDKEPFQELPLQGSYSVSDIGAQQFDQFGKIFTVKLQYIFYKERPGVRPGQVTKAERLTNKLSQFAAYAIQGDYQGVKEFGSDLKKLGLPVEHAPQISQLFKIGTMCYEDLKQFSMCIDEALFKMNVQRDRALNYKMEEVQITAVDEIYVEQDAEGHVHKQIARVRLFFLAFLSGMPTIELGVNDLWRQGKEVVGRHDIIPVVTEEWIRLEGVEFHTCVQQDEYERSRTIKFHPPDACYIELMRFRVRPPKNRELPLQLKATWCVTGNKVELRADILVPGFASRKLGQIPCEDVSIRIPIPECWIYLFRTEKHFRYGSVKSAHRRTGKIKGIERILGTVDQLQESLIEVTSGQAKYEHHHRAIVWRCPRLPKEGQGAYTTHQMVCRLALTSYDQIPEQLAEYCYVEFTMPATQVSHTTVRSVSVQDSESDDPPEKYVRYLARHEYRVGIEHTVGEGPNAYSAATMVKTIREEPPPPPRPPALVAAQPAAGLSPMAPSDSDSDSN